ncbi:MAG: hypothetical protein Q8K30_01080 [Candidatus Gracilibacteria bacterium]|nr:hypothetical protein [Candidatus Gracilibacteria bacterium]MDP2395889.1 hypothetical protein [bacterium]MDP3380925.1 hypothetical protein [bacterium]
MQDLNTKVKNLKSILLELIELLENNSIDAHALKKTYVMLEITKDEKILENLVISISKVINDTKTELENTTKKITKVRIVTSEKIDNYKDYKESEQLINNI